MKRGKRQKKSGGRVSIPEEVKLEAAKIVEAFNKQSSRSNCFYSIRFQGKFLYIDRCDYGTMGPICRLRYTGEMDGWEFAVFKWSSEQYDPDESWFPGSEYVDGTIEGALKAGLEAYPV